MQINKGYTLATIFTKEIMATTAIVNSGFITVNILKKRLFIA
jgi:hypothetical protein